MGYEKSNVKWKLFCLAAVNLVAELYNKKWIFFASKNLHVFTIVI